MKKLLIFLLLFLPLSASAALVQWDRNGSTQTVVPQFILDTVKGNVFTATSTTATSTFPTASSTKFCLGSDCRSAWPAPGTGTVTSVATNNGITGGTITTSGTLSLDQSFGAVWTPASTTYTQHISLNTASTTQLTAPLIWTTLTAYNLLATDVAGKMVATSTIGNSLLANSSVTVNTASPLGGGGDVSLGGTLNLTCTTCTTGGVTSVTGTYPIISSGGATPAISTAFGTTTANTFSLLNSFASASTTLGTITTAWIGTLNLTNALTVPNGGTGASTFGQGWIYSTGGTTALAASTSPTVNYITATSTTATSTFSGGLSVLNFAQTGSATSTFAQGLNVAAGCFAVQGNCLSLGTITGTLAVSSGGTGAATLTGLLQGNGTSAITGITGTAGQLPYYNGTNTLLATSSIFLATTGNVGIGTTSPSVALHVEGTDAGSGMATFLSPSLTSGSTMFISLGKQAVTNQRAAIKYTYNSTAASQALAFSFAGGSNLLTILGSGNVGIGTTSPRGLLDVTSGESNSLGNAINEALITGATVDPASVNSGNVFIQSNTTAAIDAGGSLAFGGRYSTSLKEGVGFAMIKGAKENSTSANYGGYLSFFTRANGSSAAERMRIDSTGNVGIGTTTPPAQLSISGDGAAAIGSTFDINNTDTHYFLRFTRLGQPVGDIYKNSSGPLTFETFANQSTNAAFNFSGGNVGVGTSTPQASLTVTNAVSGTQVVLSNSNTAVNWWNIGVDSGGSLNIDLKNGNGCFLAQSNPAAGWSCSSDERLKTNIHPVSTADALAAIRRLNPVSYLWKEQPTGKPTLGFVAQQVQTVFPSLVSSKTGTTTIHLPNDKTEDVKNPLGIDYAGLVVPTIAAVQELSAKVDAQEKEIQELRAEIKTLH